MDTGLVLPLLLKTDEAYRDNEHGKEDGELHVRTNCFGERRNMKCVQLVP